MDYLHDGGKFVMPIQRMESAADCSGLVAEHPAVALYFTGPNCAVCHSLKPRIEALFDEEFPSIQIAVADIGQLPELSGQYQVFSLPTLIGFFDGRESFRFSRAFGLGQVRDALVRPYAIYFE